MNKKQKTQASIAPPEGKRKIYVIQGSPFSWPCHALLVHVGLSHEAVTLEGSKKETRTEEHLLRNPRGKVPTLEEPEGHFVYESSAIISYLVTRYPAYMKSLVPEDPQCVGKAFSRVVEISTCLAPTFRALEKKFKKDEANPEKVKAVNDEIAFWETHYFSDEFVAGNRMSFADFAIFCYFAYLRRIGYQFGPRISAFLARMENLPAVKETWPKHWVDTPNKDWISWMNS